MALSGYGLIRKSLRPTRNRVNSFIYSDQDDLDAVLIKLAVLNFRKLSIPCSAGIKTLWFAMPSYLTSQAV